LRWISISPNGRFVATGTWQGAGVRVWDIETGRLAKELPEPSHSSVLFSPDGRWLLTAGLEYHLYETATWRPGPTISLESKNFLVGVMAFSPDSQLLAIAYGRRAIRLLEAKTARPLADLEAPALSLISGLSFSGAGRELVASDGLGQIHVWNLPLIRERLAPLKLDWDLPPYAPRPESLNPVRFEIIETEAGAAKAL
jgi:WD40 repeat protein